MQSTPVNTGVRMLSSVLSVILWISSVSARPCLNSSLTLNSVAAVDAVLKSPDPVQIAKANGQTTNTLRLDWEPDSQTFVMSLTHWASKSEIPILLDMQGHAGRTGNQFKECEHAIWEGAMCNAIVRCEELALQTEWNVYGIEYIDARSLYQGMLESGMLTHGHVTVSRRSCRSKLFESAYDVNRAPLPTYEIPYWMQIRPIIGRLSLAYVGALERGTVFGEQCSLGPDVLVGHVRGGDIFELGRSEKKDSSKIIEHKGQPPFKFFADLVKAHKRSIFFVQDHLNPVGIALASMSQLLPELQLTVHFSAPFTEVVSSLLCASKVVMGESTMTIAIGASWNLAMMVQATTCSTILQWNPAPPETLWSQAILDYSPFERWKRTPEQFYEMIDMNVKTAGPPQQCKTRCHDAEVTPEELDGWVEFLTKREEYWESREAR